MIFAMNSVFPARLSLPASTIGGQRDQIRERGGESANVARWQRRG